MKKKSKLQILKQLRNKPLDDKAFPIIIEVRSTYLCNSM